MATARCIAQTLCQRWYIVLPIMTGCIVTLFAADRIDALIPHDLNATSWHASHALHMSSKLHQIALLLAVHFLQVLVMFPMMHVTKILYGFWLGPLWGWFLCCAWELLLIFAYLTTVPSHPHKEIEQMIADARAQRTLWPELVVLALSSTPLQVDACLIEFGGVSKLEFWSANVLVTCVMSFKNTYLGYLLCNHFSVQNFAVIFALVSVSTVIPTAATVYVSSRTLYKCVQVYRAQAARDADDMDKSLLECTNADGNPCVGCDKGEAQAGDGTCN